MVSCSAQVLHRHMHTMMYCTLYVVATVASMSIVPLLWDDGKTTMDGLSTVGAGNMIF